MIDTRIPVLALLGTVLISAVSCSDPGLWGREPESVLADLEAGRHHFLRQLDPDSLEDAPIFRLHEGAGYFLGRVYQDLGQPALARNAYEKQLAESAEPYRRAALSALLETGVGTETAPAAAEPSAADGRADRDAVPRGRELAGLALEVYPDEPSLHLQALLLLYEERDYPAYLELLESLREQTDMQAEAFRDREDELLLMEAVALRETGAGGWKPLMQQVFAAFSARDVHSRLFLYLHNHDEVEQAFSETEHLLFEGKHALVEARYRDAAEHYRRLAVGLRDSTLPALPGRYVNAALARDLSRAFRQGRYYSVGLERMEELESLFSARGLRYLRLGRAELLASAGNTPAAREIYAELLAGEGSESLRREALATHLSLLRRSDVDAIPAALEEHAALWRAPWALERFFEELSPELVLSRDWPVLAQLVEITEANGRSEPAEQYRLILAAALKAGLYDPADSSPLADRESLLAPLRDARRPYYRLMGHLLLGEDLAELLRTNVTAAGPGPPSEETETARVLLEGYLSFGLLRRAYDLGQEYGDRLDPETTAELARRAAAEGELITSIRIAGRIRTPEYTRRVAELRYPLGFASDVERVIRTHDLDPALFYGLIREESHFDPAIVSHAGAIGLSQLMPATARDVARRMRLTEYELTDPATNLAIGAYYLDYLRGRFPGYLHALAAYNGGQGRVRRWLESYDLEGILFHEAIPLRETRHYVRKVVVSAAYYGYLYEYGTPQEAIYRVFPALDEGSRVTGRN